MYHLTTVFVIIKSFNVINCYMGTWQTHKYGWQVVMKAHSDIHVENDMEAFHGYYI